FFYLPIASLASIYPMGAFPIADGGDLAWRSSLDEWLCAIGQRAFKAAPFRLGLIGFEGDESQPERSSFESALTNCTQPFVERRPPSQIAAVGNWKGTHWIDRRERCDRQIEE